MQSPLKWDDTAALPDSGPERPCTPRKRLQLAQEQDRQTSRTFTRETSIRDFSTSFVGGVLQTAVGSAPGGN